MSRSLIEHPPELPEYIMDEEELKVISQPTIDKEKAKEIDEYLKHIPKDIPVEEYVAMAFRDDPYGTDYYRREPDKLDSESKSKKKDEFFFYRRKKGKKSKKKRRRTHGTGSDY